MRTDSVYFLVPEIREFASVVADPAFVYDPRCGRTMFIIILVDLDPLSVLIASRDLISS